MFGGAARDLPKDMVLRKRLTGSVAGDLEAGFGTNGIPSTPARRQSTKIALFSFAVVVLLALFALEYYAESVRLAELHSVEKRLELVSPRCAQFLNSAVKPPQPKEENGILSLLKLRWIDEPLALECKEFIMRLERERVRSLIPNPTHVLMNVLFDPVVQVVQITGETAGAFFHSLFAAQGGFLEKLLVVGVLFGLAAYGCRKKRRRQKALVIAEYLRERFPRRDSVAQIEEVA